MSRSQTVLSSISFGQSYPPYDGSTPHFSSSNLKGNGYYGYTDGLHTVQYQVTNFSGLIKVQASLATTPVDADFFDVSDTTLDNTSSPGTGTFAYSFTGNFVWVRIYVDEFSTGTINKVLYNT